MTWGEGVGRTKRTVVKRNCTEAQELHNMALASSVSKVTQSTSLKMSVKSFFFPGIYRFIWRELTFLHCEVPPSMLMVHLFT